MACRRSYGGKILHHQSVCICLNNPIIYIDLFGREPTFEEAARMAAHVYGDYSDDILIGGWYSKGYLMNNKFGLKSAIYARTKDDEKVEYAYVLAGTENIIDWAENIAQRFGLSFQYSLALHMAQIIDKSLKASGEELTFIGHSLGGGEAALCSMATGRKAITFNPAGVSPDTKSLAWIGKIITNIFISGKIDFRFSESRIDAYIIEGDPLDIFQQLYPRLHSNGIRHVIKGKWYGSLKNHGVKNFLNKRQEIDINRYK
jgi:hypothetical protein